MKERNDVDQAFAALIEGSAELLTIGKARTPFAALRRQPKRLELDFARIPSMNGPALEEEVRREYAVLHQELSRFEPGVLLFTSAEPAQGVSFTAHNLARMWSAERNMRVLLLELYNGASGLDYDLPAGAPAARDPQKLEETIRRCAGSGLYLLSAHTPQAGGMSGEAWLRLSSSFDRIILDCSPFWHNAAAAKFAPLADGVALISTHAPAKPVIDRFERELNGCGARFLGVIMNAVQEKGPAAQAC